MLRSALAVFIVQTSLAQAPRYTIHDLGPLNNGAIAGINIRGQVIGYEIRSEDSTRAFRTAPNAAIDWTTDDLGSLGGINTRAYGINSSGQVVGSSTLATGETRGFRTAPDKRIQASTDDIGALSSGNSLGTVARAINDSGQVTGRSDGYPFLTAPNSPIDPATDSIRIPWDGHFPNGEGLYVNRLGHVLGELYLIYPSAFIANGREAKTIGVTRAPAQGYAGFTDQDQVVFNGGVLLRLWQDGKTRDLIRCPVLCVPDSVNSSLQVVGETFMTPFLYSDGAFYDLSTLIQNASGWVLSGSRYHINDLGQITGIARLNNEPHAFRLDPVASASIAIRQALDAVRSLPLDRRSRNTLPLLLKATLASKLTSALGSWNQSNPAATRGFLNEFENIVRAHTGTALSQTQADQLLEMAEAAIGMT